MLPACNATLGQGFHASEKLGEAFVESTASLPPIHLPSSSVRYVLLIRARFRPGATAPVRMFLERAGKRDQYLWRVESKRRTHVYAIDATDLQGLAWTLRCDLADEPISVADSRLMSWELLDMRLAERAPVGRWARSLRRTLTTETADVEPGDFEKLRNRSIVWLGEDTSVSISGQWTEANGTRISLSGPRVLDPIAVDNLEVSINGLRVERESAHVSKVRWKWTGLVQNPARPRQVFGAVIDIRSSPSATISAADPRLAAAMLDRVAIGRDGAQWNGSEEALRIPDDLALEGGLFDEEWNPVASGTWMGQLAALHVWLQPTATKLIIEGDAATSIDVVRQLRVEIDGTKVVPSVETFADGAWMAELEVGSLTSSAERRAKVALETVGRDLDGFPMLLLSRLKVV